MAAAVLLLRVADPRPVAAARRSCRSSTSPAGRWSAGSRTTDREPRSGCATHLFFESNFNGGWEEYIDAFSYILTRGMRRSWGSSLRLPGAAPDRRRSRSTSGATRSRRATTTPPIPRRRRRWCSSALERRPEARAAARTRARRHGPRGVRARVARVPDGRAAMPVSATASGQACALTVLTPIAPGRGAELRALPGGAARATAARSPRCRGRTSRRWVIVPRLRHRARAAASRPAGSVPAVHEQLRRAARQLPRRAVRAARRRGRRDLGPLRRLPGARPPARAQGVAAAQPDRHRALLRRLPARDRREVRRSLALRERAIAFARPRARRMEPADAAARVPARSS